MIHSLFKPQLYVLRSTWKLFVWERYCCQTWSKFLVLYIVDIFSFIFLALLLFHNLGIHPSQNADLDNEINCAFWEELIVYWCIVNLYGLEKEHMVVAHTSLQCYIQISQYHLVIPRAFVCVCFSESLF